VFNVSLLVPLYMAVLDDVEERDGILSSIVNGVKWPVCPGVDDEDAKLRMRSG
jgi:hypothetical protein